MEEQALIIRALLAHRDRDRLAAVGTGRLDSAVDCERSGRRLSGWFNTIRGMVLQESGQVRLLESLIDGTFVPGRFAYYLRPRKAPGARQDVSYVTIANLDSVTMVARGADALRVAVEADPGNFNDTAEILLANALLWRPDRGPVITLSTIAHKRIEIGLQDCLLAGPGDAGGLRLKVTNPDRERVGLGWITAADPLFVDAARGNFHLRPGSSGIDQGQPGPVRSGDPDVDLDGNRRVQGAARDIGAYELTPGR